MKALPWLLVGILLLSLPSGWIYLQRGCWDCAALRPHRHNFDHPGSLVLKPLAAVQADFHGNDRDNDGVRAFWRGDVAGLHFLPGRDGRPLSLIDLGTALADDRWKSRPGLPKAPKNGFWIRALRHADEKPEALDPNRFAFCAYPAELPERRRRVYLISEGNTVFSSPFDLVGIPDVYPDEETLRTRWSKLD